MCPRLSLVNEQPETSARTLDYECNRTELSFVRLLQQGTQGRRPR